MARTTLFNVRPTITVRTVVLHGVVVPPVPDLTTTPPTAWRRWVDEVWDIQPVAAAIRHASPDLAHRLDTLAEAPDATAEALRHLVLTLLSYIQRATWRSTPFGLYAGVATGSFGPAAHARWGQEHRTLTRAGGAWVEAVVQQLEAIPAVRRRLRICANNALVRRGERLVLPWRPRALEETGTAVHEVSVRDTVHVEAAVALTRTPVAYREVVHQLATLHPALGKDRAQDLLDLLIAEKFLLTSLQAPGTTMDALAHIVTELDRIDAQDLPGPAADLATGLHSILLQTHDLDRRDPLSDGADRVRTDLVTRMCQVTVRPSPLAVDTRVDADVELPQAVAREAQAAATVLAKVSPDPHGAPAWTDYQHRFLQRYGDGVLVPLTELLDLGTGLGLPHDFHGTPRQPRPRTLRDRLLTTLAQRAHTLGEDLVLDDALVEQLAAGTPPVTANDVPPHLEMTASVHAPTPQDVNAGRFTLMVRSTSRRWGQFSGGRIAALLDEDASSDGLPSMLAHRPTTIQGAESAQVSFPPLMPRAAYITRTPRLHSPLISLSEHRPPDPDLVPPSDLAVIHHEGRLHLASLSRGRLLEAAVPHPLQLECQTPTVARFLDELERGQSTILSGRLGSQDAWDWGTASALAHLPRVRSGRSILSPAIWRLAGAGLPGPDASTAQWDATLTELRDRTRMPRDVYLTRFDLRLRLDLDDPTHRQLLRRETERRQFGELSIVEAEPNDAYDWCGGRPNETVFYLESAAPPRNGPDIGRAPVVRPSHAHLPGASRYLSARLYGSSLARRALLADHLPSLAAGLPHGRWWLTPHDDGPRPYAELTVRFPRGADACDAMRRFGPWTATLIASGVVSDVAVVPYRPHVGVWGTDEALAAAEDVLAADTAVVSHQHAHLPVPVPQPVLAAANVLSLASGLNGSVAEGLRWLADRPKPATTAPLARLLVQRARTLITPDDDWTALRQLPGMAALVDGPWASRTTALATYSQTLRASPDHVLEALVTAHLRLVGEEPDGTAWRLARSVALAATRPRRKAL
ncbi:lantibiotic dehydratase [Streptomyces sp. NPDC092952]|uniref:lantibiotic dehydratase n=1 Tax=Streptomyces sp. NPDC092952 TaxID=3366018 RepID=UPI0038105903